MRPISPTQGPWRPRWRPLRLTPQARALACLLLPGAVLLGGVIAPMLALLHAGGGLHASDWAALWTLDGLPGRMAWTFTLALSTSVLCTTLGVPMSWLIAHHHFRGRHLLLRAVMLPFVVPTLVAALGILACWGPQGLWAWGDPDDTATAPALLIYGHVFFNLGLVIRAGVEGFERVGAGACDAARSLGASPWRVFVRVQWPLVRAWFLSAALWVFLYSLSGLGLALVLGGPQWGTVEVEIYRLVAWELRIPEAAALSLLMLACTGGLTWAQARLERRLQHPQPAQPLTPRPLPRVAAWALAWGVLGVLGAPLLALPLRWWILSPPDGSALWALMQEPETLLAVRNTLLFTALALPLATLLGVCHALGTRRWVGARAWAFLPVMASPVAVALGLLVLYPEWTASVPLLIGAYAVLGFPWVSRALLTALDSLPPHWEQAARTLGCSPTRVLLRVVLPLCAPALRRGMAFAAATCMGEFAVTLFLSRPEWVTLSTRIYEKLGRPGQTALHDALALAGLLLILTLAVFVLIEGRARPLHHAARSTPD